ncbi:MAG: N-acetylmuramoyl-L-alanine amidase [Ignavibacteriales bacterium]|nr:N-acetylmuramoyl-L-alanine amidase [Ignavibacteriales bacterium]
MKKLFLLTLVFTINITLIFAQDFTGIKICINPGHGGHDSNDRFIAATGFWESDGNLAKGLYLRDILKNYGANIVMTRTTNTTSDDLALSEIVAIANQNNVDWMHAVHSNAFDAKSNYTLLLFQGRNAAPTYPDCLPMANTMVDEIYKANRTTQKMIAGDFDFYGTGQAYLGVFKGLHMPGTLSEGSFHDYVPESWRLRNAEYKKNEAWAIARSFVSFWKLTPFTHGVAAGLVRDNSLKVDYYYNPNARDGNESRKPLNKIKVTLQPGNKVYNGDEFNNGFYMFDSLAPGTYKLYFEADRYYLDSATVNVVANKTVFADEYLIYDTTAAPTLLSHTPEDLATNVKTVNPIIINFNKEMNQESTKNAFSISPNVVGAFALGDENKTLIFTPKVPLEKSTKYTVTISASAKSIWNVPLENSESFSFTTNDRNRVHLVNSYPRENQYDISNYVLFKLTFDAPITASLGNFKLFDLNNNEESLTNFRLSTENGLGVAYFESKNGLGIFTNYKLMMDGSIKDNEGYPLVDTIWLQFQTLHEKYISGAVVDSFETIGKWKNASRGAESTGIDTIASTFKITYSKYFRGKNSARLAYSFKNENDGICQYFNSDKFNIGSSSSSEFGMWVYGDLSNNILEYWFDSNGIGSSKIFVDTINWSGWKLKRISTSNIPVTGDKFFHSIVVKQSATGTKTSIIYVDDAQYNIVVPVEENKKESAPKRFVLQQNYPNPFNPSTIIEYSIPGVGAGSTSKVLLKIYDVLGNEVATLVNEDKSAGNYRVEFNSENLSSGIYFYKLQSNQNIEIRKMILVR